MHTRVGRSWGGALLLAVWLALGACTQLGVVPPAPGPPPSFSPAELVFPSTYVGYPSTLSLEVENEGDALTLELEVPAPFEASDRLRVKHGQKRAITVWFAPRVAGSFTSELVIRAKDEPHRIPLRGEALEPPVCEPSDECRLSHFDGKRCDDLPMDDGTPCDAGPCILAGSCRYGGCNGDVDPCPDDGNACTADLCLAESGCAHVDVSDSCPPPSDRCLVATCDPARGCVTHPAKDGTPCGPSHCPESETCLGGTCIQAAACAREPSWLRMLAVPSGSHTVGSIAPTADGGLILTGTSDTSGWRTATPPWLARLDRHGRLLWLRHLRAEEPFAWYDARALEGGDTLLSGASLAWLDRDGQLVTRRRLRPQAQGIAPTPDGGILASRVTPNHRWSLTRLDRTGESLWSRSYESPAGIEPSAARVSRMGDGAVVTLAQDQGNAVAVVRLSADGLPLWQRTIRAGTDDFFPMAVVPLRDGLLFTGIVGPRWRVHKAVLIHLGPDGQLRWSRRIENEDEADWFGAFVDAGGEAILFGEVWDGNDYRLQLLRLDADGAPVHRHVISVEAMAHRFGERQWLRSAAITPDGLALAFSAVGYGNLGAPLVLRLDANDRPPPGLPWTSSDPGLETFPVELLTSESSFEAAEAVSEPLPESGWDEQASFTFDPLDPTQQLLVIDPRPRMRVAVQSIPAGIACPGRCLAAFPRGTRVQLVAESPDQLITGWEHAYDPWLGFADAAPCGTRMTLDGDAACSPTFK